MSSVNSNPEDFSAVRVPNLYKKLGISNNVALKPPLPKDQAQAAKKAPRRQTMFVPQFPESLIKNFQRLNTVKPEIKRSSSNVGRGIVIQPSNIEKTRNLTPKSRFISNWISKNKEKENDNQSPNEQNDN